jgi:hypothetical protein
MTPQMTRRARIGFLLAAVVVAAVAAIVLLSSSGSSTPPIEAQSQPLQVTVRDLKPVGGIKDLTVKQGQDARYVVTSDKPEEIHTHGYNIAKEVGPGKPARFDFKATITGVFDVELEHAGIQVMRLTVEP